MLTRSLRLGMAVLCIGTSCLAAVAVLLAITDDWVMQLYAEAPLTCTCIDNQFSQHLKDYQPPQTARLIFRPHSKGRIRQTKPR
jgi:hypothetical protein